MDGFLLVDGSSGEESLLRDLKKMKNTNFVPPRSLKEGHHIVGLKDQASGQVASFIYYSSSQLEGYAMICYSFTDPIFRGKGLNTLLRERVKEMATQDGLKKIISIPFEGAASVSILKKLGYRQEGDTYILDL
jgi:RimJ/RimL family protein N-acetyltransferase